MKRLVCLFLLGILFLNQSNAATVTLTLNPSSTGWANSSSATSGDLSVSNSANRGYAVFNLSSLTIPTGCVITSVTLGFTITAITGTTTPTQTIYGYAGNISSLSGSSIYSACTSGTTALYTATWGTAVTTKTMASTAAAISFVTSNISGTVSMCWVESGTGTRAYSIDGSTTPVPVLTVQYCTAPAPVITATPNPVCAGANVTFSSTPAGATYAWTGPNSFTSTAQNPGAITASSLSAGTYSVTTTLACGSWAIATKVVTVTPTPTVTVTPSSTTYCFRTAVPLTASGATTYAWTPTTGLSGATGATVNASPASTTTYTVTGTASGCTGTAVTTVNYSAAADAVFSVTARAAPTTTCSGGASTLYNTITNTNFNTVTSQTYSAVATGGTAVLAGADDDYATVTIPFNFNFYGVNYTSVNICSNGFINFGTPATDYSSVSLPSSSAPEGIIALFWHDLNLTSGNIKYTSNGTAPNRKFIVSFNNVPDYSGYGTNTGQIVLYETSNNIDILIASCSEAGGDPVTVGVQNLDGSIGIAPTGRNYTDFSTTSEAWRFTGVATSGYNYTWTPASSLSSSTASSPYASPISSSTTFTLVATDPTSGCTKSATAAVTVGTISGTISPNTTACNGGHTNVVFTGPGNGTATYKINGGSPITVSLDSAGRDTVVTGTLTSTTIYSLISVGSGGCSQSITGQNDTITVISPPTVSVSRSAATYCAGGSGVTLSASGTATAYTWSPATGLSATTGASISASPSSNTTYTVTGSIGACAVTASTSVNSSAAYFRISATGIPTLTCVGGSSTLSSTINNSYFNTATPITYAAVATTGTSVLAGADDEEVSVTLPFTFYFYGAAYNSLYIGSNGYAKFGAYGPDLTAYALPNSSAPSGVVSLFEHDLILSSGNIKYSTLGSAPNRQFVISFNNVPDYDGSSNNTGQIIFYETLNYIDLLISHSASDIEATCGVQNLDGSRGIGVSGRNGVNFTANSEAYRITGVPSTGYTYSWAPAGMMSSSTAASPIASPISTSTTFTVVATDSTTGCAASATTTVNTGTLSGTISGTATICSGSTTNIIFTGPAGATATYTINGGSPRTVTLDASGRDTLVTDTLRSTSGTSTTYTYAFTRIDVGTCSVTLSGVSTVVTVLTPPSVITGASAICISSTTTLSDSISGGTWSNTPTTMGTVSSTTGVFTSTTTTGATTVSYTIAGCTAVTYRLVVGSGSPAAITPSTAVSVCVGATTTLADATASGAWSSSDITIASVGTTGIVTGVSNGSATITYSTGCGSPATKSVTVNGATITLSSNSPLCTSNTLNLSASLSSSGSSYSWTGPNGFSATGLSASLSSLTTSASGVYTFSATISGCANTATTNVYVENTPTVTVTASPASICSGGTSTLTDVVTAPTTYTGRSLPYSLVAITGTAGPSGDDDYLNVSIPFSFSFYGHSYSSVNICTNGFINFGTGDLSYSALPLPSSSAPEGIVALFWHDMNPGASQIKYATVGTTPNRKFVVYYNNVPDLSDATVKSTGEIILYETSNKIEMHVLKTNLGNVNDQTCGIQNIDGSQGITVPGENDTAYAITAGTAYQFTMPSYTYSWTPSTGLSSSTSATTTASGLASTTIYTVTTRDIYSYCSGNVTTKTVNVVPNPVAYNVTGGGGYCSVPGTGVHVGLSGSDTGVTYQLYKGGSPIGSTVAGTGSALDFGLFTDTTGAYTVTATNNSLPCSTNMTGSVHVSINPTPTVYAVNGGVGCSSPGVVIGLSGSESGTNYQLFKNGSAVTTISGTGTLLSYGTLTDTATYTVVATSGAGCVANMSGTATVGWSPAAYTLTGGSGGCSGSGITVGLSGSQTGATYQLYNYSSTVGSAVSGTSSSLSFGLMSATGVYSVIATGTYGCTTNMNGNDTVYAATAISLGGNPSVCAPATSASISYSVVTGTPNVYNISWSSAALTAGFTDVSSATLSGGFIGISLPTGVTGTYTGSITVSNGSCISASYPFSVRVESYPTAQIASADVPCSGHSTTILITGTTGASISYNIDSGTVATATLTGGSYSFSTGSITTPHVYALLTAFNAVCTTYVDTAVVITPNPMTWMGGASGHETEWNIAANWSCGFVPSDTDAIIIPSGRTYYPVVPASSYIIASSITIATGAQLTLDSSGVLSLKGTLSNNGVINGGGTLTLNGTTAQSLDGIGKISNLDLNNSAGATIASSSRVSVTNTLSITAGDLLTNDSLVLESDSIYSMPITIVQNARVAALPASGASITGNVRTMQYILGGRRAYRFWAHPFSGSIPLSQIENYIDITGPGGSANGFTTTGSNAASSFRYDPYTGNSASGYDPGWKQFSSTYGTPDSNEFKRYMGIRLMYRGSKGTGLDGASYTIYSSKIGMWGPLNQGNQNIRLAKGSRANQDYNMVGNPYPSPVDIGTVVYNAKAAGRITGAAFFVWNPYLGSAGQFQAVPIGTSSASPYYIQAYNSFQVRAAHDGDMLNFTESNKSTTSNSVLLRPTNETLELTIYDGNYHPWDMTYVRFDDKSTTSEDDAYDALKLSGLADLNFYSTLKDGKQMSIDTRPFEKGAIIPLGIQSKYQQEFIIKASAFELPDGGIIYLHDKLLNKYVQLEAGTEYRFTIDENTKTQGNNRFELSLDKTSVVNNDGELISSIAPNPTTDNVTITLNGKLPNDLKIRVIDISGVAVFENDMTGKATRKINIPVSNFAAGTYMVEVTGDRKKQVQKLIKE